MLPCHYRKKKRKYPLDFVIPKTRRADGTAGRRAAAFGASADEETGARVVTLTCTVFNTVYQLCRLRAALKAAASSEKTRVAGGETRTAVHLVMAPLRPGENLRLDAAHELAEAVLAPLRALLHARLALVYALGAAVLVHAASRGEERAEPSKGERAARGWGEEVSLAARPCSLVERARVAQTRIARGVARGARDGGARAASPHGDARATSDAAEYLPREETAGR